MDSQASQLLQSMSPKPMILVMDITGAGKSSFINQLPITTEKRAAVGEDMDSCTEECETLIANIDGTQVLVVDTPGFDDNGEGVTDAVILERIARLLTGQLATKAQLKGIIYLQRISDPRIGQSGMKALKILQEICGTSAMDHVTLTTTWWGINPDKKDEKRETFLQEKAWSLIIRNGARIQRYYNSKSSALGIVRGILENADVVLDIQDEIVKQGKPLHKTNAGVLLSGDIATLKDTLETSLAEIERLKRELSTTRADKLRLEDLNREYAATSERLKEARAAEEILKKNLRDQIKVEIEAELAAKNGGRKQKINVAAKVITTVVAAAASIISMLFGIDPSFAADVSGWFN